ncbi:MULTISPECIES: ice-binding family protein [Rhodomicrobium]|uniref:ice-binding family protein n=1 Tax=Rhodomicrobium TaxID=1068 RepID=UPI000F747504|nr:MULTISPECIES: ice-binding family protein [Rhodomicrobium]
MAVVAAALGVGGVVFSSEAEAQNLGTAEFFGVLGSSTVTNTGPSVIRGNVGTSPGTAIVGFPPGIVVAPASIHAADALAAQARVDTITAYNALQALPSQVNLTGQNLGNLVLSPAVYSFATSAQLTGLLTLNGQGNSAARFVFQIGSTLTTASNSAVLLINGANGDNVFWAVGSSATLGTNTRFAGNILALTSITLNTGASITCGRALAQNGAVTLDNNAITLCINGVVPPDIPGGTGNDIPTGTLFGSGVTGFQNASFGALGLFGLSMMRQGMFWRDGGPEDYTGITPQSFKDMPGGSLKDAAPAGWDGIMPQLDPRRTWRLWTTGYGGTGHFDGDRNEGSNDLDTETLGFSVGLDYQFDPTTLVGIAAGYSNARFSVDDVTTHGQGEGGHVGVYGVKTYGRAYVAGAADYAHFHNDTDRFIDWLVNERANSSFDSDGFAARFEAGWKQPVNRFYVTPFVGAGVAYLNSEDFTEDSRAIGGGPGILGLSFDGDSTTSVTSSVGVQLDTRILMDEGRILTPFARVAWVHEFEPDRDLDGFLTQSPAVSFTAFGAPAAEDAAKVDAGFRLDLTDRIAVFAYFDGEFSDDTQIYSGNGGVRIAW